MRPTLLAAFVAATLPSPGGTQEPAPTAPLDLLRELRVPVHEADDGTGTHALWAAGADYKVRFADDVTFVPRPTDSARSATPWHWATTAIRVGGTPLGDTASAPVSRADEFRVEIDRGGVVEAYDVLPDGVEQTFVLASPMSGDLEIVGAVSGAFAVTPRPRGHAPLDFVADDGSARLRYGAATAIDATGARLPLATEFDAGRIRVHVPATWLATATYPVVVDPLLQPILLDGSTAPVTAISIERNDDRTTWNQCVVLSRRFAATDEDVFAFVCDEDFASRTLVFSRVTTATETDPDVAVVLPADRWVIAYTRLTSVASSEQVWFHAHGLGSLAFDSSILQLPSPTGGRQRRPAVGGVDYAASAAGVALFVREVEPANTTGETNATVIWGTVYDVAAGTAVHVPISNPNQQDSMRPSVSRSHDGRAWLVAWQRLPNFGAYRYGVMAVRVGIDGATLPGGFFTDRDTLAENKLAPVVDGMAGRYLIAFAVVPTNGSTVPSGDMGETLWVQRFDWPLANSVPSVTHPSQRIATGSGGRFFRVDDVAMDRVTASHWAIQHATDSALGHYVTSTVVGYRGLPRNVAVLGYQGGLPSAVACDRRRHRFVIAYPQDVPVGSSTEQRVYGRVFTYPAQTAPLVYGSGCGAGQIDGGEQPFLIGNEFPRVGLDRAAALQPAWLLLSLSPTSIPLDAYGFAGCRLLVDPGTTYITTLAAQTNGSGIARADIPLPETLPQIDVRFQWAYFDALLPSTLRLTQGLRVEVR